MTDDKTPEVRVSIESAAVWHFAAPSPATTLSEVTSECIRRYEQLYEAFGEFITPTELQTMVEIYDQDWPLADGRRERTPRESNEIVLTDEVITPSDVAAATVVDGDEVPYVTGLGIKHGRYRFRLDQGEKVVDREDCVLYMKGESRPNGVLPGPIKCSVNHYPSKERDPIDTDYKSVVSVNLHSDVWMGGSEGARINRERLGAFLGELDDRVSPAEIKREVYEWDDFWYNLSVTTDEWGRHTFDMEAIY